MENDLSITGWIDRYAYFIVVFLFGTALSLGHYANQLENAQSAFEQHARQDIRQFFGDVEQHVKRELGTLETIQDFVDIESDITEAKFTRMARSILEVKPYIRAFSWVPRIQHQDRDEFVNRAQQKVLRGFRIKEALENGKLVTSSVRREYFPATYIVPKKTYLDAFGFDLASEPRRKQALTLSGLQNLRVMTEPVQLVSGSKLEPSILIFAPIYKKKALAEKRLLEWQDLKGYVLMVLRSQEFFRHIFESAEHDTNIALKITDRLTGQLLAQSRQFTGNLTDSRLVQVDQSISAGQRQWHITGQSISGVDTAQNLTVSLLGILISVIFGLYIQVQKRQNRRISEEVHRRTLDLKQRSDELDIANQRLELALLSTRQGIWDWDLTSNEVYFSPSTEVMAGYQAGEWKPEQATWSKLIHADEYACVLREIDRHLGGETDFYVSEHRIKRKDGRYMWIRDQGRVVEWDEDGNSVRMLGSHVDIDDQKKIEMELIEARDAAEQAAIAKTQFLSTMSHEIRTPMNGVIGMAQLLEDTELTDEQREYVDTINRSGSNLLNLINDILDFSKLDANKTELEEIPFDLEEICAECLELFAVEAAGKKIDLILDYEVDGQRRFIGDPSRLRQVVLNLVGNAVKFTSNGYIRLAVASNPVNAEYSLLTIEVEDTGIGIPEGAQAHLFDEFTQADQATTRRFGGTGLGLAIVQKIVNLMKGNISVKSECGKGSRFIIDLELPVAGSQTSGIPESLVGNKVLLVDGQVQDHRMLIKILRNLQLEFHVIDSPDQAVGLLIEAEASESPYKLVILDHEMQNRSGLELGIEIRKQTQLATVALMMFSTVGQKMDSELHKKAGFNAFVNNLSRKQTIQEELQLLMSRSDNNVIRPPFIEQSESPEETEQPNFKATILLAEDIKPNQIVTIKFIQKLGGTVEVASNGEEAVEMWRRGDYDMILMDCRMPVMDGYQATRMIRKLEQEQACAPIPIIAVTANASTNDCELCKAAGMNEVITKPFRRQELYQVFEQWLPDNLHSDLKRPVRVIGA